MWRGGSVRSWAGVPSRGGRMNYMAKKGDNQKFLAQLKWIKYLSGRDAIAVFLSKLFCPIWYLTQSVCVHVAQPYSNTMPGGNQPLYSKQEKER